ncbi:hypothetical protein SCUCBS95973_005938 [Sporothrix curviconia]|uniref:Amidoligase enzyme n=1 Tax=Sporothrix curviconia TaxID=1260050 RepID=A0ABP0C1G8_9PEZI
MSFVPLKFGVEIELLLGHKAGTAPFASWENLAVTLSRLLARAGVRNHVAKKSVAETYQEWSLMREVTIPDDPVHARYAVELVSPVFDAGGSQWVADVEAIFAVLDAARMQIHASDRCSTHVHVSTHPHALGETAAMHLAEAVLYYEAALDALVPAHRQTATAAGTASYWSHSNRASHMFSGIESVSPHVMPTTTIEGYVRHCHAEHKAGRAVPLPLSLSANTGHEIPLDTCLDIVRTCYDLRAFSMDQVMNWMAAGTVYGRARRMATDFVRGKVFKWNFESLYRHGSNTKSSSSSSSSKPARPHRDGTVEFRLPPGSVQASDVGLWVSLAATFVAGALAMEGRQIRSPAGTGATLGELRDLLEHGQEALGWQDLGLLQDMLNGVQ